MNDSANGMLVNDRIQSGDCRDGHAARVQFAYPAHVFPSELCSSMQFAGFMIRAPLLLHIVDIVGLRTEEKMFPIDAETVVAFVANAQFSVEFAIEEKPCGSVGKHVMPLQPTRTISPTAVDRTNPSPAPIRTIGINSRHESLFGSSNVKVPPQAPFLSHVEHYSSNVRNIQ